MLQPVTTLPDAVLDSEDPEGSSEAKAKKVCSEYNLLSELTS